MDNKKIFSTSELLSYMECDIASRVPFRSVEHMAYYLCFLLLNKPMDAACLVLLHRNKRLLTTLFPAVGALYSPKRYVAMMEPYLEQAKYYFIGHTHKDAPLVFSNEDIRTTQLLREYMDDKMTYLTHIVVGSGFRWAQMSPELL